MLRTRRTSHRADCRLIARMIGCFAALVVVLGVLAGALHHHDADESPQHQHPCVVCALHHAPATPIVVAAPVPPPSSFERVTDSDEANPHTVAAASGPTRAPPSA